MSVVAVIVSSAPTFTVATANTPVLFKCTMPSFSRVAARATMSGTGVAEAVKASVFSPTEHSILSFLTSFYPRYFRKNPKNKASFLEFFQQIHMCLPHFFSCSVTVFKASARFLTRSIARCWSTQGT